MRGVEELELALPPIGRKKPKLAHIVVFDLVQDIEGEGQVITTDDCFSNIGLFKELLGKEIYATSTMWSNCVGLPDALKNTRASMQGGKEI